MPVLPVEDLQTTRQWGTLATGKTQEQQGAAQASDAGGSGSSCFLAGIQLQEQNDLGSTWGISDEEWMTG